MKFSFASLAYVTFNLQSTLAAPVTQKRDADFNSVRMRLDHPYVDLDNEPPGKYFHESNFHQHYDGRFANKPLKYDEKQAHLTALIQTYLLTMNEIGAETWLMHGTLLGWWWNRRIMPWDSDLDVMLSERSLHFLASYHNMTVHYYKFPHIEKTRSYLLEINPHWIEIDLDRDNQIDARWIDRDTGVFIDITTLRRNTTEGATGQEQEMVVKDKHHYFYDDIYPLRESAFEGISVNVPYAYGDILIEEYGNEALSGVNYQSHRYDEDLQAWIPHRVILSNKYENQ